MPLQRFYNATDKLINAFIMGTLNHETSCSCAVGNICNGKTDWALAVFALSRNDSDAAFRVIDRTGYSGFEIFEIERSFEQRASNALKVNMWHTKMLDEENDPDGFKGLCNVFDYMVSIEDWSEEEKKVNLVQMCLS